MNNIEIYLDKERRFGFYIDEDRAEDFLEAWDMFLIVVNLLGYSYHFEYQIYSKENFSVIFGKVDNYLMMEFNLIGLSLFNIRVGSNDDKFKTFKCDDFEKCLNECQELL